MRWKHLRKMKKIKNKKGKEQKMLVKKLKNTIKVKKLRLRLILIKMNVIA